MKRETRFLQAFMVLFAISLAACGVHITEYDLKYNPYKEAQTLVFDKAGAGPYRLYVLGWRKMRDQKPRSFGTVPSLQVYASTFEDARMSRRDPAPMLLYIERTTMQAPMLLQIRLDDLGYSGRVSQQSNWDDSLTVKAGEYEDVEVVENELHHEPDELTAYAKRVYWSKRHGLIAIDMSNGLRYELKRIEPAE
ncbi:MAG: hypothetical protein ACK51A_13270 [Sphingobacteriia bacterium]|jgi:hypothetical protein